MMSFDAPTQAMQPQAIEDISKHSFNDLRTHIQANSQLTCCDALTGQQHDARETDTEDGTLAKVEQGERGCGFQRGQLVGLQVPVILFCFIFLIVEVL